MHTTLADLRYALLRWSVIPLLLLCTAQASAQEIIKVGVYSYSPMVFVDEQMQAKGLFVDVLDLVAAKEGWKLDYRPGTWAENMERLESGEIDLLVNIAVTEERSKKFDFTQQHVFLDWGMVYRRKGSKIDTIFDLPGKRIAILKNSFYAGELRKLLDQFAIGAELVDKPTFADVFKAIESGEVDAGSNANLAGLQLPESSVIEQTAIAYAPTKLRFAVKKGSNQALLAALDQRLSDLYADKGSDYYKLREKWLGQGNQRYVIPAWVLWALASLMVGLVSLFAIAVLFRKQVREKTASLRESEENIAITLNSIGDAVIATDTAGRVTRMNPSAERLTGWSLTDARERPLTEVFRIINADTRESVADPVQLVIGHGKVIDLANHTVLLARDGHEYQIADSAAPIRNAAGEIVGVVLVFSDITGREQAEENLRESEERLRDITFSTADWIWEVDEKSIYTYCSEKGAELLGRDTGEIIGKSPFDFMPADEARRVAAIFAEHAANKAPIKDLENWNLRSDGTRICLLTNGVPIMNAAGALKGYRGIDKDITERKREERLLKLEHAVAALLASSEDAYDTMRKILRTICESEGWGFGLHWRADDAAGVLSFDEYWSVPDAWADLYARESRKAEFRKGTGIVGRVWESGKPIWVQDVAQDKRIVQKVLTESRLRSLFAFPLFAAEKVTGVIVFLSRDQREPDERLLTAARMLGSQIGQFMKRKRTEEERQRLEAQLRESQKMEALGTLAGGVAHDFNNALATILGNVALARQDVGVAHPALESLEEIGKAGHRARNLVQQILAFGRRQVTERNAIALCPVVQETARLLRATLPAGVNLEVHCAQDAPDVLADATQIEQVVLNLCTNAWHALQGVERPGLVEIQLEAEERDGERFACLTVRDNGRGMDAATRARIFEPFFTTKAVGEGTGLGLSVVHGLVKAHGASMEVRSQEDEGSSFILHFPAAKIEAAHGAGLNPRTLGSSDDIAPVVQGQEKRILYLDDEASIVSLMSRMLERRGYRVQGFTDAQAALAQVRASPGEIDLVVTDYNMPGLSGLDVARALRDIRPDLPVALASGYITEELRAKALAAGVRELIYKPDTSEELIRVVARLVHTDSDTPKFA